MKPSDRIWYGRAATWLGAGLLLFMAFSGVQLGIVVTIAVGAVIVGIILLVYSIPWRGGDQRRKDADV